MTHFEYHSYFCSNPKEFKNFEKSSQKFQELGYSVTEADTLAFHERTVKFALNKARK